MRHRAGIFRELSGAQAAHFVNAIKAKLEDVALWKKLV